MPCRQGSANTWCDLAAVHRILGVEGRRPHHHADPGVRDVGIGQGHFFLIGGRRGGIGVVDGPEPGHRVRNAGEHRRGIIDQRPRRSSFTATSVICSWRMVNFFGGRIRRKLSRAIGASPGRNGSQAGIDPPPVVSTMRTRNS